MPTEKIIKVKIDTGDAVKSVDKLDKSIDNSAKSTSELSSVLDKTTGGAISKFKGLGATLGGVAKGFKTLRMAIISTGIGALVIAVTSLVAAFQSSEEGQNKLSKIMTIVGALTGNLVDLFADLGEKIIAAFENPQKALNDLVDLIRENLTNRLEGLLELFPKLASAVKLLFKGEFSAAGKVAADAAGKVVLGVENVTDKVKQATEAVKEFTKEQIREANQAAKVADMRAKADKIERKLIVDRSKLESEIALLRLKSRQEEEFSAAERRKALLDAQALEETLLAKETEFLELRRDAQVLENTFSRSNKENLDKEAQAIAEVNRQVALRANAARATQRELNRINKEIERDEKAKVKEEEDKIKAAAEIEKKRLEEIDKIRQEFANKQKDAEAVTELQKLELERTRALEKLERLKADEEQLLEVKKYYADQEEKVRKTTAQKDLDLERAVMNTKLGLAGQGLGIIKNIAGEGSKVGKAAAIAEATISGIQGTINAFQTAAKSPITTLFPAYPTIQAGLAAAFAATNIAKIKSTKVGATTSPTTSTQGGGAAAQAPNFNVVGSSGVNQLAEVVAGQTQTPVQAYVVANDVTTAQSLNNNIVQGASIG